MFCYKLNLKFKRPLKNFFTYQFRFLLLFPYFLFAQSAYDDYEIYAKVISERMGFGLESKTDSVLLVEKFKPLVAPEFDIVTDITADSIPNSALNYLSIQTYGNDEFVNRIRADRELKMAIKGFAFDFENHPQLNSKLLATDNLAIQTITPKKYHSYFGKSSRRFDSAWKRIKKIYGTRHLIQFSKIKYHKNFAIVYYEHLCGGLCGSGNMVIFEKQHGAWSILSEINFWMS